ncbi:zinc dependent phospholipase C family protein [Fusibacter bizertensis]|uniref:Zinc dependent phospholipase C family protein n=1 Tax=Fusibacter bizertensis TaxID=1488331 RepID=A0ABT6NDK2_9FIRM|nr:zinc dependent phospholipase C family protein [Fusibacter bizertensis]MDH8678485.1 zinc dependent phospholipase C family protein [Fusibacter bizertensis]
MPDFWSHHFAALKAKERLAEKQLVFVTWPDDLNNLYALGSQGPDFFYYINKMNPLTKHHFSVMGNRVHEENIAGLFFEMLTLLLDNPSQEWIAYISGFMSHYILDVHCHPLICALGPKPDSHKRVEMDLDALCLYNYWHLTFDALEVSSLTCSHETLHIGFVSLWEKILPLCYDAQIPPKFISKGHFDLLKVQSLLVKGVIDKLPFTNSISKILHYDLDNLRFPDVKNENLKMNRKYDEFITHYELGISETVLALSALDEVISKQISITTFIDRFIKFDFLGEAQDYVRSSTKAKQR